MWQKGQPQKTGKPWMLHVDQCIKWLYANSVILPCNPLVPLYALPFFPAWDNIAQVIADAKSGSILEPHNFNATWELHRIITSLKVDWQGKTYQYEDILCQDSSWGHFDRRVGWCLYRLLAHSCDKTLAHPT
jgi:hypothetical protein